MIPTSKVALHDFSVVSNEKVGGGLARIVIEAPQLARSLEAGQFLNVEVPGDGSQILRVPLSFSHADGEAGTVEIVYAIVGDGTRRLSEMRSGDASTVVGPSGNPWPVRAGQGRSVVVAGGVGVTPIVACARALADAGVAFDAVVGAQTADKLWGTDVISGLGAGAVAVTTDDGTAGLRGFTTDALRELLSDGSYEVVYACGPEVMMRGVARICAEAGVTCWVSMERMMSCAFGACGTCNVAMAAGGYKSACMEGPVFDAEEVAW